MISILRDVPLAPYTTFRIGGSARFFAEIHTEHDLLEALAFAESESVALFILGGGSNLLIPDTGYPGLVLHLAITGPIEHHGSRVEVPAGTDWDSLVRSLCEQGISGMECLAGIPGLTGASPIQNIGAYGQEVSQTLHTVRAYDRQTKQFTTLSKEDCRFAYRQSIFNTTRRNRYILTHVTFALDPTATPNLTYPDLRHYFTERPHPTPLEVYEAVRSIRRSKGMLLLPDGAPGAEDTHSAGSFFKNPVVLPSALAPIAAALDILEGIIPRYPLPMGRLNFRPRGFSIRLGFTNPIPTAKPGFLPVTRSLLSIVAMPPTSISLAFATASCRPFKRASISRSNRNPLSPLPPRNSSISLLD